MRANRSRGVVLWVGALVSPGVAAACGDSSGGFVEVGVGSEGPPNGASSDAGSTSTGDGATQGSFFSNTDATLPSGVVFACKPGTYSGTFTTMVTSDAGGLATLFSFNWTGSLSITLVGEVTMTSAGEFESSTLKIAPGAKLAGVDTMGGRFNADLSGQLDCPSKTLTATVADGTYSFGGGDAGGISMQGTMSATYDGTASPPALTMGGMDLSSPQLMGIGAAGSWTATLQ